MTTQDQLGPEQELLDRTAIGTERRVGLKSPELATHEASNGPGCKIDLILHGPLTQILTLLRERGVLLQADANQPSVATLVAGGPVRGSWWGHAAGAQIYAVLGLLEDHADALSTRLLDGKVTYVHRRLWPALMAVGQAGLPWQLAGLKPSATELWQQTTAAGELPLAGRKGVGEAATDLERRLLVVGRQVHTEAGHHARILTTWSRWQAQVGQVAADIDVAAAQAQLAAAAGESKVPWQSSGRMRA